MNAEEKEKLLADYFLGNLDWEQSEHLDELLLSNPKLRAEMMQLQEGLEADVMKFDEAPFSKSRLRNQVLQQIGVEDSVAPSNRSIEEPKKTRLPSFWKWGIAAAVLLTVGTFPFVLQQTTQKGAPVLAVFEIGEGQDGFSTPMKKVFYEGDRDVRANSLYMAELQAEKLWSSYMDQYRLRSEKPKKQGFVVLDLRGHQGFVGIYNELLSQLNKNANEGLTLSFGDSEHPVSVGVVSPDGDEMEGVFYFSLKDDLESEDPQILKPKLIKEIYNGI